MDRQVGWTGLVQIGKLLGKGREEEKRDNDRKDIFWGIKEDEVMDHLQKFYCRFYSFLYALSRSRACRRLDSDSQVFSNDR